MAEPPNYVPYEGKSRRTKEIEFAAYIKWREAGSPPGDGKEFWLAAEQEWEANKTKGLIERAKAQKLEELKIKVMSENPTACPCVPAPAPKQEKKPKVEKVTEKVEVHPQMPHPKSRDDESIPWWEKLRRLWVRQREPK